jgi:RNA polymerase-binding protein DksA
MADSGKKPARRATGRVAVATNRIGEVGSAEHAGQHTRSARPARYAPSRPASAAATRKVTAVKTTTAKPAHSRQSAAKAPVGELKVRAGEDPWTQSELRDVHDELQAEVLRLRAEILNAETEIADLLRDSGEGAGDDQADTGTKNFEREHEMSLANNARDMLVQSERALRRIDDGSYGLCESCGSPIGKARLQAFPRATLCVSCKQREERR